MSNSQVILMARGLRSIAMLHQQPIKCKGLIPISLKMYRGLQTTSARLVDKPKYDMFTKRKSEWRIPTLTETEFNERSFLPQVMTGWAILTLIVFCTAIALRHDGY